MSVPYYGEERWVLKRKDGAYWSESGGGWYHIPEETEYKDTFSTEEECKKFQETHINPLIRKETKPHRLLCTFVEKTESFWKDEDNYITFEDQ